MKKPHFLLCFRGKGGFDVSKRKIKNAIKRKGEKWGGMLHFGVRGIDYDNASLTFASAPPPPAQKKQSQPHQDNSIPSDPSIPLSLPLCIRKLSSLLPLPLPPNLFLIPIHQSRIFLPRPTPSFYSICKRQALHARVFLFLDIIVEPARSTGSAPS